GETERDGEADGPDERVGDEVFDFAAFLHVAADEQVKPLLQIEGAGTGGLYLRAIERLAVVVKIEPAIGARCHTRLCVERTGEHPARRIEHQIEALARIARALDNGMNEKRQTALPVLLRKPRDFDFHGLVRLAGKEPRRVPIDIGEE